MAEKTKEQMRKDAAVDRAEIKKLKAQVEEGKKINNDNAMAYALTMKRCKGTISVYRFLLILDSVLLLAVSLYVLLR